jgi:integrase
MPRTRAGTVPKLQHHKATGQARVTLAGRDFYCGRWGSKDAIAKYHRLLAEYFNANGSPPVSEGRPVPWHGQPPAAHDQATHAVSVSPAGVHLDSPSMQHPAELALCVCDIAARYLLHAETYYRDVRGYKTSSYDGARMAIRALEPYFDVPAVEFGPLRLQSMRALLVEQGRPRVTCNRLVKAVRRLFKWAASQELIPVSVSDALATVDPLRAHRTKAPELPPVKPVSDDVLEATLAHLPKVVADMARLHRLTGARPGELCSMRPCDIDRTDPEVWEYRPETHKNTWRGEDRVIHIGPKAQAILARYLERPADRYCFSPQESEAARHQEMRARRKSPVQPSQRNRRKKNPRRPAGDRYTRDSYRRAVQRAAKAAGVASWFPNQLRHAAGTEIRKLFGIEASQTRLGHKSLSVTEVYAERDLKLSRDVACRIG